MAAASAQLRAFASAGAAGAALAEAVAKILARSVAERGAAALAVPGGRTPGPFLSRLFDHDLNWPRISLVPTDDRWVPVDSPNSNEGALVALTTGRPAAAARLIGLVTTAATPEAGRAAVNRRLDALPRPFDAVVLGMGEDGHVASLFPGQPLSAADGGACLAGTAPAPPRVRISFGLERLLETRFLFLLIGGETKRLVFEMACNIGGDGLPVLAIMRNATVPLEVFWYEER